MFVRMLVSFPLPVFARNTEVTAAPCDVAPSMFGRPLKEQIAADGQPIPVIVSKCIEAVEAQGKFNASAQFRKLIFLLSYGSRGCIPKDGWFESVQTHNAAV